MKRSALVTGGAGFIGSHVVDLLSVRGWSVDVIDDLSTGRRENVTGETRLFVYDVASDDAARLAAEGRYDVVIHLAAQMDVRRSVVDPVFDARVNVIGTLRILEAVRARAAHARPRIVFASSGGAVYGDLVPQPTRETEPKEPDSPYGIAKLASEYYFAYAARVHGLDVVSLRFANVYGPRQDPHGEAGVVAIFCGRILDRSPLVIYGDGEQTRDYVHVSDVAEAIFAAATSPLPTAKRVDDRAFNIGTGIGTSVRSLAAALLQASGVALPTEAGDARPGEQRHSVLAADRARSLLGWQPNVALNDGLKQTFSWFAARAPARDRSRA